MSNQEVSQTFVESSEIFKNVPILDEETASMLRILKEEGANVRAWMDDPNFLYIYVPKELTGDMARAITDANWRIFNVEIDVITHNKKLGIQLQVSITKLRH